MGNRLVYEPFVDAISALLIFAFSVCQIRVKKKLFLSNNSILINYWELEVNYVELVW